MEEITEEESLEGEPAPKVTWAMSNAQIMVMMADAYQHGAEKNDRTKIRTGKTLFRRLTDENYDPTDPKIAQPVGKASEVTLDKFCTDDLAFAFIEGPENKIKYNMYLNTTDVKGIQAMLESENPELF
jgi:hypothetical protein